MTTSEIQVQRSIISYIEKELKGYTVKVISCNKNGFPDIHFLLPARPYSIPCYCEVKREGKVARPLQLFRIKELNEAGGIAFEADSLTKFKEEISHVTR